jgi:SAM-dependent methyltransferase
MSLPDLSRIEAASPETLRAFGQKLATMGVTQNAARPAVEAVKHLDPVVRGPARAYHLRKRSDAVGHALRMFLFEDPVTPEEARAALGPMADDLLALGLLEEREGGVVSPFVLGIVDDLYVLSDVLHHGDDAVMGLGETTVALAKAVFPRRRLGRVLELGCGAGAGALLLSRSAASVVGTDINPRAVALARVNAAINGVKGVEFRVGDRLAPVAGEKFDLVFSQPPFVPRAEGVAQASALYGGFLGDEVALSMLSAVPRHLTAKGRAVLIVEWPEHGQGSLEQRLRAAVGEGPDLLVLRAPDTDLGVHATAYAAGFHPTLGPAFAADVRARLEHFERAGIRALAPTLVIVARPEAKDGWTAVLPIQSLAHVSVTSERIDKLLAARTLTRKPDALLAAKLRVPEGTELSQTQMGPGAEVPSTLSARFPPDAAVRPIEMTMDLLFLITLIHEAPSLNAALPKIAEVLQISREEALTKGVAAAKEALLYGILEVAQV